MKPGSYIRDHMSIYTLHVHIVHKIPIYSEYVECSLLMDFSSVTPEIEVYVCFAVLAWEGKRFHKK